MRRKAAVGAIGLMLAFCGNVSAATIDEIVGVNSPSGGTLLVKRFEVPSGATIIGVKFWNNDSRTVFPEVSLLRGPVTRLSEATVVAQAHQVGETGSHEIRLGFDPIVMEESGDLLVAVSWPPSDGVHGKGDGTGIGATILEQPAGSFLASRREDDLQQLGVDLAIKLIFQDSQKAKRETEVGEIRVPRFRTFLQVDSPITSGKSVLLRFGIEKQATTDLAVYDVAGREVRRLLAEVVNAGEHARGWDGADEAGRRLAAGVYVVRLRAGSKVLTQKIVLAR